MRKNKDCFWCREIKSQLYVYELFERLKVDKLKKESVRTQDAVSTLDAVVESDPKSSEYSASPKSVGTIKVATKIENTVLPKSLVDCGATINLISSDEVTEHSIPARPIPLVHILELMNAHDSTLVNNKVVSKVELPGDNWESHRPRVCCRTFEGASN